MQPETSSGSVKTISLDRQEVIGRLHNMAQQLIVEHPEVAEVRLFGSLARGDQTGISDADVLVILHSAVSKDPHVRALTYLPYFDMERGVDLLVLTARRAGAAPGRAGSFYNANNGREPAS